MDLSAQTIRPAFSDYGRLGQNYQTMIGQFQKQEPVHAYLLTGAAGIGKMTYARFLVSALYCQADLKDKPCGQCDSCKRMLTGSNPDVTVLASDSQTLKVDDVRQALDAISQFSFGSGYRAVLIEPVEKLTPEAQNCLLKSLEEPPAQVVFLLMSHDPSAVLSTIVSRCMKVQMRLWPDELVLETLTHLGHPRAEAENAAALCGGNIGSALHHLCSAKEDEAYSDFALSAMKIASDADAVRLSTRLKEDRGNAEGYLLALEQAIDRTLRAGCGQLPMSVIAQYPEKWWLAAQRGATSSLVALLSAVVDARRERAGQVNWQSNIDRLMLKILEETKTWL